jgi:hypothetical protein
VVDPRADVDTAGVRTTFLTAFDHAVSDAFMVPSHSDDGVRASVPGRIFRNRGWARHDAAPKAGRTAAAAQPAWHASNRRGDGGGGGGGRRRRRRRHLHTHSAPTLRCTLTQTRQRHRQRQSGRAPHPLWRRAVPDCDCFLSRFRSSRPLRACRLLQATLTSSSRHGRPRNEISNTCGVHSRPRLTRRAHTHVHGRGDASGGGRVDAINDQKRLMASATCSLHAVLACTSCSVTPSASSVSVRPLPGTLSSTHSSVMMRFTTPLPADTQTHTTGEQHVRGRQPSLSSSAGPHTLRSEKK